MRYIYCLAALVLLAQGNAFAETDREKAAREIDQQMKDLVKPPPPPALTVYWEGADSEKVAIDEARFELDDTRLSYGELEDLLAQSKNHKALFDGPVDAGKHQLSVHLVVHRTKVSLFEGLRTTSFKISSAAPFPGQAGLQITLRIKLHFDETQTDPKKRLRLDTRVEPKMVGNVDDAPMPERAHTVVAEAKADDAPVVKPVVAKNTPADDASQLAKDDEAPVRGHGKKSVKPAKIKSPHHESTVAVAVAVAATEPVEPTHVAPTVIDAGAPDAGPPDAGPLDAGPPDAGPVAVVVAEVDAGAPVTPATGSGNVLWMGIGVGALVFVVVLVLGLRKRKQD